MSEEPRAASLLTSASAALVSPMLDACTQDRKSTRLNSSHANISYAVFCLKKKTNATLLPHEAHPPSSSRPRQRTARTACSPTRRYDRCLAIDARTHGIVPEHTLPHSG